MFESDPKNSDFSEYDLFRCDLLKVIFIYIWMFDLQFENSIEYQTCLEVIFSHTCP